MMAALCSFTIHHHLPPPGQVLVPSTSSHKPPGPSGQMGSLGQAVHTQSASRVLGRYTIDTCRWLLHV